LAVEIIGKVVQKKLVGENCTTAISATQAETSQREIFLPKVDHNRHKNMLENFVY